jgi:hypothetical protein
MHVFIRLHIATIFIIATDFQFGRYIIIQIRHHVCLSKPNADIQISGNSAFALRPHFICNALCVFPRRRRRPCCRRSERKMCSCRKSFKIKDDTIWWCRFALSYLSYFSLPDYVATFICCLCLFNAPRPDNLDQGLL